MKYKSQAIDRIAESIKGNGSNVVFIYSWYEPAGLLTPMQFYIRAEDSNGVILKECIYESSSPFGYLARIEGSRRAQIRTNELKEIFGSKCLEVLYFDGISELESMELID